ncbi:hypothetical protein UACE39S_04857 [Ureibacillus acetophenoni]
MQRGKGMKFVGDSRIKANNRMANQPIDYSEYPGKTEAFWPDFLLKEWMVGAVFLIGYLLLTVAHSCRHLKVQQIQQMLHIFHYQTGTSYSRTNY